MTASAVHFLHVLDNNHSEAAHTAQRAGTVRTLFIAACASMFNIQHCVDICFKELWHENNSSSTERYSTSSTFKRTLKLLNVSTGKFRDF